MANRRISDLPSAASVGTDDLFVLEQARTAKKLSGATLISDLATELDGHGGIASIELLSEVGTVKTYRINYVTNGYFDYEVEDGRSITSIVQYWAVSANGTTAPTSWNASPQSTTPTYKYLWTKQVINYNSGSPTNLTPYVSGVYGDKGDQTNVYIRWGSGGIPQTSAGLLTSPSDYIGICATTDTSAPTDPTRYSWYQYKGDTGVSITGVQKTSQSGLQDTYTIYYSNSNTSTFVVTNGSNISTITKGTSSGLTDNYIVTLTSGATTNFQVTNGKGIASVTLNGSHLAGAMDEYTILYNDGDTYTFQVYNGANGTGSVSTVSGIQADGNGDVPQVISGNGAPTTSTVGQPKQLYFDLTNSSLYYCVGVSDNTYTWAGTTITVDSSLSSSSTNPVQNKVITAKVGTGTLNTTATNLTGAVNEVLGLIPSAGTAAPSSDMENGTVGVSSSFARADHRHTLNVATSGTPSADGTGALGSATTYAKTDHVHPINVPISGTPADLGTASNGSATTYARSDHVHNKLTDKDIFDAPYISTASAYPTTAGVFAVTGNIFTNLVPPTYYGTLEIEKCAGYQRHIFTTAISNRTYIGWIESNSVAEPTNWIEVGSKPKTGTITTSTTWTTQTSDYTQTVTVTGATVTSNSKVDIQPNTTALTQMLSDGCTALYVENNAGTLTLHALGTAPTVALTLQVTMTEVS